MLLPLRPLPRPPPSPAPPFARWVAFSLCHGVGGGSSLNERTIAAPVSLRKIIGWCRTCWRWCRTPPWIMRGNGDRFECGGISTSGRVRWKGRLTAVFVEGCAARRRLRSCCNSSSTTRGDYLRKYELSTTPVLWKRTVNGFYLVHAVKPLLAAAELESK